MFVAKSHITAPGNQAGTECTGGDGRLGKGWHALADAVVFAFKSVPNRFNSIKFLLGFGVKPKDTRESLQKISGKHSTRYESADKVIGVLKERRLFWGSALRHHHIGESATGDGLSVHDNVHFIHVNLLARNDAIA